MKQQCKTCGKNCEGGEYCFQHKPRKALKSGTFSTLTPKNKVNDGKVELSEMSKFFLRIWNKRKHVSEISGEILYSPPSSAYFHHILPKEKYPEICYCEDNIVILSLDEHTNVESDIYRYEEINRRRKFLKEKYGI